MWAVVRFVQIRVTILSIFLSFLFCLLLSCLYFTNTANMVALVRFVQIWLICLSFFNSLLSSHYHKFSFYDEPIICLEFSSSYTTRHCIFAMSFTGRAPCEIISGVFLTIAGVFCIVLVGVVMIFILMLAITCLLMMCVIRMLLHLDIECWVPLCGFIILHLKYTNTLS